MSDAFASGYARDVRADSAELAAIVHRLHHLASHNSSGLNGHLLETAARLCQQTCAAWDHEAQSEETAARLACEENNDG
jgi:hypothetical protein